MTLNKYLDIAPEVQKALDEGRPVVALESTIISHGMPYPQNVETALNVEKLIRENGAVPATIAVIGGRLKAGLSEAEIDYLGKTGAGVTKASRRDLPILVAEGRDGATTVTTTMIIAHMAGIQVFATGGIGGVHRGAQQTFDISADLEELAHTPVMVVCAGAKSILDLGLTLEYLETHGVPVIGYGTEELPAFYTRKSGFKVDYRIDTPAELAKAFYVKQDMGLGGGMLVTNPIPEEYSMDHEVINKAIDEAVAEANRLGIHGKETTPFLLAKIKDITGGDSLASNIQLVYNNARLAAKTVVEPTAKNGFIFTLLGTKWGFLWLWLLIINVAAFLAYGLDKLLAKLKARHEKVPRLPERNLLLLAIVGGGIGAWLGMEVFRHKTQHRSFRVVVPLFTCLWLVIVTGAYLYFNVFR